MASLLESINSPSDLHRLAKDKLPALAAEIRQFLLESLAKTGGHLGSNLGVVELTIALHYVFDSPRDALMWDVSHQIYTHKILTGRRERFPTLRQLDGLAGFARRSESEHDVFDAGHGGTSLSVALGIARARALTGTPGRAVAIIGDGALTSGMALEALNDAGHSGTNLLVVLNDNAMAISPSVGALSRYLGRARSEEGYLRAKALFEGVMRRIPGGDGVVDIVERMKGGVKHIVIPGMLFEDLGFTYLGPVDGHDFPALLDALQQARRLEGPVVLHVNTTKGKGYSRAEEHNCRLHGVMAFDLESGEPIEHASGESFTDRFGSTACRLAQQHPHVVAISAAMCEGTGLAAFRQQFPKRFYDVGMAEEHGVTLAAGMAREGIRPITTVYSTFLQRAFDQIMHDVCLLRLPVVLVLDRAGLVGEDGPTHHGVFDLSFLRMFPNMTVAAPATLDELDALLEFALTHDGPVAIRYPKGLPDLEHAGDLDGIAQGRAAVLREGADVAIFAVGSLVGTALKTADLLAEAGLTATVINARFIKPLDAATLLAAARTAPLVVTLEENVLAGGFGAAVQEMLAAAGVYVPVHAFGLPDRFIEQGHRAALLGRLGLTPEALAKEIRQQLPLQQGIPERLPLGDKAGGAATGQSADTLNVGGALGH